MGRSLQYESTTAAAVTDPAAAEAAGVIAAGALERRRLSSRSVSVSERLRLRWLQLRGAAAHSSSAAATSGAAGSAGPRRHLATGLGWVTDQVRHCVSECVGCTSNINWRLCLWLCSSCRQNGGKSLLTHGIPYARTC